VHTCTAGAYTLGNDDGNFMMAPWGNAALKENVKPSSKWMWDNPNAHMNGSLPGRVLISFEAAFVASQTALPVFALLMGE
jgi:hypothetical protein